MSAADDQRNAREALAICKQFESQKLATDHSIVVQTGYALSRLGIKRGAAELACLAINDHRSPAPVTLFAVRCLGGNVDVVYLSEGQSTLNRVPDGIAGLSECLDDLLDNVDSQDVDEVIASDSDDRRR